MAGEYPWGGKECNACGCYNGADAMSKATAAAPNPNPIPNPNPKSYPNPNQGDRRGRLVVCCCEHTAVGPRYLPGLFSRRQRTHGCGHGDGGGVSCRDGG